MKILALEFSSEERSVAVVVDRGAGIEICGTVAEKGGRQTNAFAMIENALRQAEISRDAIDCFCVGIGPGSYTGIRVAIAVAQGWQLARKVNLLGISSADCLAHQMRNDGHLGAVSVAIDAQRNEFYLAAYAISKDAVKTVEPLRLVSAEEVNARISSGQAVIGPALRDVFPGACDVWPQAATLARLASQRSDFVPGEQLEPIYLRTTTFVKTPPSRVPPP
jgi:tRNA threonylcarbamoyl adenosine modification protein YeaZ